MTLSPHIEKELRDYQRKKNLSEVEYIHARELIIKLVLIKERAIREEMKEKLKIAA